MNLLSQEGREPPRMLPTLPSVIAQMYTVNSVRLVHLFGVYRLPLSSPALEEACWGVQGERCETGTNKPLRVHVMPRRSALSAHSCLTIYNTDYRNLSCRTRMSINLLAMKTNSYTLTTHDLPISESLPRLRRATVLASYNGTTSRTGAARLVTEWKVDIDQY
jgi:hypothetical protein